MSPATRFILKHEVGLIVNIFLNSLDKIASTCY